METGLLNKFEEIRERHNERMRKDGGPGSGNWGHLGRPGARGGSQSGGGSAFRFARTTSKGGYTSQAKMRKATEEAVRLAESSGNSYSIKRWKNHADRINMKVKSADKRKAGNPKYHVVKKIDLEASKNILMDPERGKEVRENNATKVKGTQENVNFTFPYRAAKSSGSKGRSKGGKSRTRKAK